MFQMMDFSTQFYYPGGQGNLTKPSDFDISVDWTAVKEKNPS
jgi:hypothetical protein